MTGRLQRRELGVPDRDRLASDQIVQPATGSKLFFDINADLVGSSGRSDRVDANGPAILLLHGYAETSRMWRPLIPRLAASLTVIAPDLPGIGGSDIPKDGLDMKRAAIRIHNLVKGLGVEKAEVVGHDIGLMVAYASAAQFPAETEKLVLMDAFLPGVDGWEAIYNNPTERPSCPFEPSRS